MQRLLIQALALRQLGRLSTHKLLNPGHRPYWTLHTPQLCGSSSSLTLGTHKLPTCWNSAKTNSAKTWSCLHHVRFKSSKKKGDAKTMRTVTMRTVTMRMNLQCTQRHVEICAVLSICYHESWP
ncbi:hypothetical protein J4Q44_G00251420 [Coregonus suidteri]|uniref:Uncharacterized protein n=1 Tax=Coregonus suidteri TaxID=861788 RepID=A0AAN8LJ96_9TELE